MSDSMPSTAMPSASLANMSANPGSSPASSRARARTRVGEEQLAARGGPEAVLGDLEAALVGHLEPADLLDRVAPELDPDRVFLRRREDVENAAANRELAPPFDEVGPGVSGSGQGVDDVLERSLVAGLERNRSQLAEPSGHRLQHGTDGGDDDRERPVRRVVEVRVRQPAQHR